MGTQYLLFEKVRKYIVCALCCSSLSFGFSSHFFWKKILCLEKQHTNFYTPFFGFRKRLSCSRLIPCIKRQSFVAAGQSTRTRNHLRLTGNVRQSSTVIWFNILEFSRIVHKIHLFLQLLQLENELLNSLVILSILNRELINLLHLRSLHSFHFVLTSSLRIFSKSSLLSYKSIPLAIEFVLDDIQQIRFLHPVVPDLILPDSGSDLYCLRAEFHSHSTDRRFRTQIWFLCSSQLGENKAAGLPEALWS